MRSYDRQLDPEASKEISSRRRLGRTARPGYEGGRTAPTIDPALCQDTSHQHFREGGRHVYSEEAFNDQKGPLYQGQRQTGLAPHEEPDRATLRRRGSDWAEGSATEPLDTGSVEFLTRFKLSNFENAAEAWEKDKAHLLQLKNQIQELEVVQQQALSAVDRFSPEFDESIKNVFVVLNKKMTSLVRLLMRYAPDQLNRTWIQQAEKVSWTNPINASGRIRNTRLASKLWLRREIWNYFEENIISQQNPFVSFAGSVKALAITLNEAYEKMQTHSPNDITTAKWRLLSIEQLERMEVDEDKEEFHKHFAESFAQWAQTQLGVKESNELRSELLASLDGGPSKSRKTVIHAVQFARQLARQRATYSFERPSSDFSGEIVTNDGTEVGVDEAPDDDGLDGDIRILVTPAVCKWGDENGGNVHQRIVLTRALISILERDNGVME